MPFSSRYSQRLPPSPGSTSNSPFRQSRVLWEMCTRLHGSERPGPRARQQGAGRPRGRPPTPWSLSATSMRQEGDVLRLPRALRGVRNGGGLPRLCREVLPLCALRVPRATPAVGVINAFLGCHRGGTES